jgi:hypothetical protein
MILTVSILLAFGAGFALRSILGSDPEPEIGRGYGSDRYHRYD